MHFVVDLGLPGEVENMCPLLPSLEQAVGEVEELACAGAAASQAHYIHVTEVTLPMLCSYMSLWWHSGPEGQQDGPICTSVIPQHANNLLGHILRIIHNHVGTRHGDWMKQMAGIVNPSNTCVDFFNPYQICIFSPFSGSFTVVMSSSFFSVNHTPCPLWALKQPLPATDGEVEKEGRMCAARGGTDESRRVRSLWSRAADTGEVHCVGAGPLCLLSPPHSICGFS